MYILPLLIMPCLSSAQLQQDLGFDLGRFYFQQPLAITADGSLSPHVIKKKKERKKEVPGFQTIIVFCCFLVPACYQQKPPHQWDQEARDRNKAEIISLHLQDLHPHQLSSQPLSHPYLSGMTFSFQLITRLKIKVIKNPQIHCFTLTTPPKGKHHILWVARQNQSDAFQCLI